MNKIHFLENNANKQEMKSSNSIAGNSKENIHQRMLVVQS